VTERTFIYALIDPRTSDIRYIGKADDAKARLAHHIRESKREKTYKARWIRSLLSQGLLPILQIIDEVLKSEWQAAEAAYLEFYREEGCRLVNTAPGGHGGNGLRGKDHPMFGKIMPAETKAKMSAANRGQKRSPEFCARLRAINTGKKLSAEHRAKMSAAMSGEKHPQFGKRGYWFGKKQSAATIAKMSAAHSGEKNHNFGKKFSRELRAKLSAARTGRFGGENHPSFGKQMRQESKLKMIAALTGRKLSADHRLKISLAMKGVVHSEQMRAKLSASLSGRKLSQETRNKMSIAKRQRQEQEWLATMWD